MTKTAAKPAAATKTTKPAAKPARKPVAPKTVDELLVELTAAQSAVTAAQLDERRDADSTLMVRRNELILSAIAAGAGFAQIARARGVATSTNRGLIRVLQGGKRI